MTDATHISPAHLSARRPETSTDSGTAPSRADLIERWIEAYGVAPPKGLSLRLLTLAAGYNDQVKAFGGLPQETQKRLGALAKPATAKTAKEARQAARPKAVPGTRLMRTWRGKTHVVDVVETGVLYDGQTFGSLSEVARHITGARWSGPRFFGLQA